MTRVRRLTLIAFVVASIQVLRGQSSSPLPFSFTEIAGHAGLTARTIFGGQKTNRYLLETTGCGAAAFDYDGDGWLDIFLVNGTTLEGFPPGTEPTSHLYRNRRDERSRMSRRRRASRWQAGDRASAQAITTTAGMKICSSPSSAGTGSSGTAAMARSRM